MADESQKISRNTRPRRFLMYIENSGWAVKDRTKRGSWGVYQESGPLTETEDARVTYYRPTSDKSN